MKVKIEEKLRLIEAVQTVGINNFIYCRDFMGLTIWSYDNDSTLLKTENGWCSITFYQIHIQL